MAAMNMQNNMPMIKSPLKPFQDLLPDASFAPGKTFYWSPKTRQVFYDEQALETEAGQWALLHEIAHAQLDHTTYNTDAGLLALEVAAWQKAEKTAQTFNIVINPDHIQDCLDTYRDWLYARSTCPTCRLNSLQTDQTTYTCLNCLTIWSVSKSRFCRPYRMQAKHKEKATQA